MQPSFWLDRWRQGQIGFHQAEVNTLLAQHWPALSLPPGSEVLVPLAGKSLDMLWLAGQGHRVTGIELSDQACAAFFVENGLEPVVDTHGPFRRRRAGAITLLAGDIFDLPDAAFDTAAAAYDRAALIALPEPMRSRYVERFHGRLRAGSQTLLITLDYPPDQMAGPPFPVDDDAVRSLFGRHGRVALLERRDILREEPAMAARGLQALHTSAWHLRRDPDSD